MERFMKVSLKLGLLAAVVAMAVNIPQLSAQTYYGSSTIGTGYTHLIALSSSAPGPACYLGYNTIDGSWEIGTLASVSLDKNLVNKQAGGFSGWPGWTQFSSFNVGAARYYVQYNKSNGRVQINKMDVNCTYVQTVFDDSTVLPLQLTHVVAMNGPGGTPLLLAYDSTQTSLQLYVIETTPSGVPSALIQGGNFSLGAGYTNLMPYNFNGYPSFVAQRVSDGFTTFNQFKEFTLNTYSMTNVGIQSWGSGWVAIVPALTTQEFLAYSRSNPLGNPAGGVGAADLITINNGVESAKTSKWNTGWDTNVSLLAPFYFQNVDSATPTLPGFVSYYQGSGQIQVWMF